MMAVNDDDRRDLAGRLLGKVQVGGDQQVRLAFKNQVLNDEPVAVICAAGYGGVQRCAVGPRSHPFS